MSNDTLDPKRHSVLIIDDEKDLREALFMSLAAQGYEVLSATDGVEGLASALAEHPDLILLDLQMPNMRGEEFITKLQEDPWGKQAKVVVLTALSDMDTLSKVLELGCRDYIVKSDVDLEDIGRKVAEVLAR